MVLFAVPKEEYKIGMMTGVWNRRVEIGKEEVIMLSPSVITHQVKAFDLTVEVAADSSIVSTRALLYSVILFKWL